MNITHWANDDICYMTIFIDFLECRCSRVKYGQHPGHLKKKNKMLKQKIMKNVLKKCFIKKNDKKKGNSFFLIKKNTIMQTSN
jgi:hypothetical protein